MFMQRDIQKVRREKWAELEKIERKFEALESALGFPPKARYRSFLGGHDTDTLVIEWIWDSLAQMEEAHARAQAHPELQALEDELNSIVSSIRVEVYRVLE